MNSITMLRRMWAHLGWADDLLWPALATERAGDAEAWREYSHIIGAEEVWLARIEGRASRLPIWPEVTRDELRAARQQVVTGYARLLDGLTAESLDTEIDYRNSAGVAFTSRLVDMLIHVALHGQYHRGKINLLLRGDGVEPVPTDYISFVRGSPAAVTRTRP